VTGTVTPLVEPDEISRLWAEAAGLTVRFGLARKMTALGWTAAEITRATRCARHILAHRLGTYPPTVVLTGIDKPVGEVGLIVGDIWKASRTLIQAGRIPLGASLDWVEAVAGDRERSVTWHADYLTPSKPGLRPVRLQAWSLRIPADLAPLAYAAGLTPAEAREQQARGLLSADGLRALAALRGAVPLPPLGA
jgi:hypothetical protein